MNREDAVRYVQQWTEAWNHRDLEAGPGALRRRRRSGSEE